MKKFTEEHKRRISESMPNKKGVVKYNIYSLKPMTTYISMHEAQRKCGVSRATIKISCNSQLGERRAGNFYWQWNKAKDPIEESVI